MTSQTLPDLIARTDETVDSRSLSLFLGLASGGGVGLRLYPDYSSFHVNYNILNKGAGRSYGVGPKHTVNDPSDSEYLESLYVYLTENQNNHSEFYSTLLSVLLDSDSEGYEAITPPGQAVLSDFLLVYVAELYRNLIQEHIEPYWEAALLEVTFLGAFHAGQREMKLYYTNPQTLQCSFTNTTMVQEPCITPSRLQRATMKDYWQFTSSTRERPHCLSSGINLTKDQFRLLGKKITNYVKENKLSVLQRVSRSMDLWDNPENLYQSLSLFLISEQTPNSFSQKQISEVIASWVSFLDYVQEHAEDITADIELEEDCTLELTANAGR